MILMLTVVLVKYVTAKKTILKRGGNKSKEYKNPWSGLYRFSKEEIENAIYNGQEILGRGSAGHVYKGILPSGQEVAIKHLNQNGEADSFMREVQGLSKIRHPNLVCLFGYCMEDDGHYLVYEYCAGGNLAQHLLSMYFPLIFMIMFYGMNTFARKSLIFLDFKFPSELSYSYIIRKSIEILLILM